MVEKSNDVELNKKIIKSIKKKKIKIVIFSVFMVMMLLSVNAYAWFIYISKSNLDVSANIVSWDVNFFSETSEVSEVKEQINNVVPGMLPYVKNIEIKNNSDFNVEFKYNFKQYTILGQNILPDNFEAMTNDEILNYISERYPFSFSMQSDADLINHGSTNKFKINFGWNFEDVTKYYKLTELYSYNPSFEYYRLVDGEYVLADDITSENYSNNIDSLYLYKDDADSYFGMECPSYENTGTGRSCVTFSILMLVQQTA